jgi:hypothetical protein
MMSPNKLHLECSLDKDLYYYSETLIYAFLKYLKLLIGEQRVHDVAKQAASGVQSGQGALL